MLETVMNKYLVCEQRFRYSALPVSPRRHRHPAHWSIGLPVPWHPAKPAMPVLPASFINSTGQQPGGESLGAGKGQRLCCYAGSKVHMAAPLLTLFPGYRCGVRLLRASQGGCCRCLCPGEAGKRFCRCCCSDAAMLETSLSNSSIAD